MKKFIILSTLLISLSLVPIQAANENTFKKSWWGHPATIIVESALILAGTTLSIACKKAIINKYKEKITIIKNLKKHLGVKKLTKELLESPDAIAFAKQHNQLELLDDLIENFDQMKTIQNKYNWGWIGLVGGIFISGASTIALLTSIRTFIKDKKAEEEFNKKEKERLKKEADEKKRIKEKERKKREEAKRLEEERKRKIREIEENMNRTIGTTGIKLIKKPGNFVENFRKNKTDTDGVIEYCLDNRKQKVTIPAECFGSINTVFFINNSGYYLRSGSYGRNKEKIYYIAPCKSDDRYYSPKTLRKAIAEDNTKKLEEQQKKENLEFYPYNKLNRKCLEKGRRILLGSTTGRLRNFGVIIPLSNGAKVAAKPTDLIDYTENYPNETTIENIAIHFKNNKDEKEIGYGKINTNTIDYDKLTGRIASGSIEFGGQRKMPVHYVFHYGRFWIEPLKKEEK